MSSSSSSPKSGSKGKAAPKPVERDGPKRTGKAKRKVAELMQYRLAGAMKMMEKVDRFIGALDIGAIIADLSSAFEHAAESQDQSVWIALEKHRSFKDAKRIVHTLHWVLDNKFIGYHVAREIDEIDARGDSGD